MAGQFKTHFKEVVSKLWNAAERCETEKDHIHNATFGLVGEAGEVADIIKKMHYHKPKPDGFYREELKLELGDVMFYWLKLVDIYGFTYKEILEANKEKLYSRYADKVRR